jgi:hypothetical protein
MSAPAGTRPELALWLEQLEIRLGALETAQSPMPVYACTQAQLPAAAAYLNCVVRVSDLNILAASDGTNWRRQDTGAAI